MKRAKLKRRDMRSAEEMWSGIWRALVKEENRLIRHGKMMYLRIEPAPEPFPLIKRLFGNAT